MARQRGTSGRRVGSDGRSGAVGARGKPGVPAEGEREVEAEAEGVPLTTTNCQKFIKYCMTKTSFPDGISVVFSHPLGLTVTFRSIQSCSQVSLGLLSG